VIPRYCGSSAEHDPRTAMGLGPILAVSASLHVDGKPTLAAAVCWPIDDLELHVAIALLHGGFFATGTPAVGLMRIFAAIALFAGPR